MRRSMKKLTKMVLFIFNLKEYDIENEVTERDVFIFKSKRELYEFFLCNGASFDKNLFDSSILFNLSNGDLITSAKYCIDIINNKNNIRKKCINK